MHALPDSATARTDYLHGKKAAWFAFAMTMTLMVFDYIDRQVIVSMFPHIKEEWGASDKQLGALVSAVSITVALGSIPVALVADRFSRVKSIFVMALTWSVACIACMFSRNYGQLLAMRAVIGVGEAGYGAVGAALISAHFPARMRGMLMAAFFGAASLGSVLGVVLGGVIAKLWGWKAAFGVVGIPGVFLALLYLKVKDYPTVALDSQRSATLESGGTVVRAILDALRRSRTILWASVGGAMELLVVSSVWSWLPSYLNRFHGLAPEQASVKAALVVLAGAVGGIVTGALVDRMGLSAPRRKLWTLAALCTVAAMILGAAFGAGAWFGPVPAPATQFGLILLGGLIITCTTGPVTAIIIDVVHPGVRSTGASVLALFLNLFGLALGPFVAGTLSDALGLRVAMAIMPVFGIVAALCLLRASASYEADMQWANQRANDASS